MSSRPGPRRAGPSLLADAVESRPGFIAHLGLRLDEVGAERVTGHLDVGPEHLQPYGLVHGGVYAAIAETLASLGAMAAARRNGPSLGAVGLENHTSFLRGVGAGRRIEAEAVVRHGGRRVHHWTVTMRDASDGRELAVSAVRLLVVDTAQLTV